MSKQKTAVNKAIELLQQDIKNCLEAIKHPDTPNKEHYVSKKGGLSQALGIISSLLPTEQQQIEQAYNDGCVYGHINDSETYFATTYGAEHSDEDFVKKHYPEISVKDNLIGYAQALTDCQEFAEWCSLNGWVYDGKFQVWCHQTAPIANKTRADLFALFIQDRQYKTKEQ